jgi:hypothetical protein
MEPFKGKCEMPQDVVASGIVTVAVNRSTIAADSQLATGSDQSGVAHTGNNKILNVVGMNATYFLSMHLSWNIRSCGESISFMKLSKYTYVTLF